ncbi:hypothetical protein AAFF_G00335900 [Aldrovandia affinis]|uniref:Uncharacterized protein n=1 Tax=Aldrovandia affinis TaxID=143900 RepID=A0AAD7WPQ5_9TELE|nr:hypothetical protein AAFF_G00335900 [Aldrovandia affinis]
MGPEMRNERAPPGGGVARQQDDPEGSGQRPDWLELELLKQEHRRHSIALGDAAALGERRLRSADPSRSLRKLRDEFCTYMQLEYVEKEESVFRGKQAALTLPACIRPMCHGEPVRGISIAPNGIVVTVREDGAVYYWNSELQLKKSKTVFVCLLTSQR